MSNNKPSSAKVIVIIGDNGMNVYTIIIVYEHHYIANTELMACVLSFHYKHLKCEANFYFQW